MKDIDFDELDKAVNSALAGTPPAAQPKPPAAPAPVSDTPSAAQALPPTLPPTQATTQPPAGTPPPTRSAPVRRSGRFMDVVQPAPPRKVETKPTAETPTTTTSRTVHPLSPDIKPDEPASLAEATQSSPASLPPLQTPQASEPIASSKPQEAAWPDPLDVTPVQYTGTKEPDSGTPPPLPSDLPANEGPIAETVDLTASVPKSPFIQGTKVEKHPLGAFSSQAKVTPSPAPAVPVAAAPELPVAAAPAEDDRQLTPQPASAPEPEVPRELSHDLVSLEGNDNGTAAAEPTPPPTPPEPAVPVSIPRQYTPSPRAEGKDDVSAAFHGSTYQAPLAPAKKSSSKAFLIVLAVIFVAALVAAGYWWLYLR